MALAPPTIDDIRRAAGRISPHAHRTPVATSATLDAELGLRAFFKCENLQKVGAFKARGALNAVLSLGDAEARPGVLTHSSGNHGQALAYAAAMRGIECTVVMPEDAPAIKRDAVAGYGARIVLGPRAAREELAAAEVDRTGATFIHPYDDPAIIAGQGTAALELLTDHPELDAVVTPVGGGGLMSGTAIATRAMAPGATLIGAEPAAADNVYRSFREGRPVPAAPGTTSVADGLLSGPGHLTLPIMRDAGVDIELVGESEILTAARFHLERMKLAVEPSGAAALAALRQRSPELAGSRVGVIVSGGNTDFSWLC